MGALAKSESVLLAQFANALREALDLEPIYVDGSGKRRETTEERFGMTYAWPSRHRDINGKTR